MKEWRLNGHQDQRQASGQQNRAQQPPIEHGPKTASKTDGGQSDNRECSTEVIYSGSNRDSDSGDNKDSSGVGVKRERRDPLRYKVGQDGLGLAD